MKDLINGAFASAGIPVTKKLHVCQTGGDAMVRRYDMGRHG